MRVAFVALLLGACGGTPAIDAGTDAGTDAGSFDAALVDAALLDAARIDASVDGGPEVASIGVLSLNLHCLSVDGTAYRTNTDRFAAIADVVARERIDVLLLQEVCDDGRVDAATELGAALETAGAGTFESHVVFAHVGWEGTPEEARESVAVFARDVIDSSALVHRDQTGLRRVAASASVQTSLGALRVLSVHFDHRDAVVRPAQAREAAAVALSEGDPSLAVLVGGDLNARAGTDAYAAFSALGYIDASADAGGSRIDHIFVHRGAPLAVAETRRLFVRDAVSDHPGVLVRFVASTPTPVTVTRIIAAYEPSAGSQLSLRGDTSPLSWELGWPMHDLGDGRSRFVSTEFAGAIELKALIDDTTWQAGENEQLTAGAEYRFSPTF